MPNTKDVSWIKKTIKKAKNALKKVDVKHEKSIKRHLDAAVDKLDTAEKEKQNTNMGNRDNNKDDAWTELSTTLEGWGRGDTKRFKGGKEYAEVVLPKNGFRSQAGVNSKYKLKGFPTKSAELSYELFVDKDWDPVKGGKLPGLYIGKGTGGKAYEENDGSFRIMWRRGGQLVGYLYPCTDQGNIKKNQGREFLEACGHEFPEAGIDLWRSTKDKVFLKKGEWNKVCMGWTLNDPKTSNGQIWLEVNGTRFCVKDARITDKPDKNQCSGVQWSMWYGGSNASWAPSKDQSFKFRNIKYHT